MINGPDPFTNYEMKGPKSVSLPPADTKPEIRLDEETLRSLGTDGLITLVQRISAARWGEVALLSDDDAYEAVCLKLLHGGLTQSDVWKALPALKEWIDRRRGKPPQSVALTVEDKGLSKLSTERLLALEKTLARITGEEALIIAPMPEALQS